MVALAVVASSYYPTKIIGRSGEMTSDMDHAALIATALVLPLEHALMAFTLGETVLHIVARRPGRTFAFNVGQHAIGAWACLHVMHAIDPMVTFSWRQVLAVTAGATVFEICSVSLVAGAVATDRGVSYWSFVRSAQTLDDTVAYFTGAALGHLTGVAAQVSLGAGLLVAGPLLLVHNITRGFEAAFYDRIRARALSDAASAMHDSLTGVANRASFLETVDQTIRRRQRYGGSDALLFIDLDGSKGVNDGLGHGAGDELLIAIADRLQAAVRPSDVVARLGGDEFCVLALEVADDASAATVANALLTEIRRPFQLANASVTISASVGVALLPAAGTSADELIK